MSLFSQDQSNFFSVLTNIFKSSESNAEKEYLAKINKEAEYFRQDYYCTDNQKRVLDKKEYSLFLLTILNQPDILKFFVGTGAIEKCGFAKRILQHKINIRNADNSISCVTPLQKALQREEEICTNKALPTCHCIQARKLVDQMIRICNEARVKEEIENDTKLQELLKKRNQKK